MGRVGTERAARLSLVGLCLVALLALILPAAAGAASRWQLTQLPAKSSQGLDDEAELSGVSCPTDSLCVAVGALDTIATSSSPAGERPAWQVFYPTSQAEPGKNCTDGEGGPAVPCGNVGKGGFTDVSCASASLCVAVAFEGATATSTDPAGGAAAWSVGNVNRSGGGATHLTGVSCPSTSLCVAVAGQGSGGSAGKVLTTTEPLSGQWQVTQLDPSLDLRGVSCAGSLCVAVARGGRLVVSADPTGGAASWKVLAAPGGAGDLEGVDCIAGLCAAGNATGNVLTIGDPTAPGASWSATKVGNAAQITGVSCPTASACLAVDDNGNVITSTDPTGGTDAWHAEALVPFEAAPGEAQFVGNALFAASCSSTSLCAAVGSKSRIFTSSAPFATTTPAGPAGAGPGTHEPASHVPLRPRTFLVFAEDFWSGTVTRRRRVRARFHFYSPTRTRGFQCKRDRGPWRRCRSPLRYWVGVGHHALRVRAIGPTGMRGKPAVRRFRVARRRARR